MSAAACPFSVGDRVSDKDKNRGTVRYVGPVAISYKDPTCTWVGVEWDAAGRGKYDGSVTDKSGAQTRYFTCSADRGSFIKPGKLLPNLNFVDAVKDKYLTHDSINGEYRGAGSINISAEWENNKKFNVELVGVEKIQRHLQMEVIDKVSLENENVGIFSNASWTVGTKVPNLEELNLDNTLLSSWADIFHLLSQLPKLNRLYLSRNRFQPLPAPLPLDATFSLKILVLNNTNTTWVQACALGRHFPALEELHLEANGIQFDGKSPPASEGSVAETEGGAPPIPAVTSDPSAECPFPSVRKLNLSKNGLHDWNAIVDEFRNWPQLRHLMLNGNQLAEVTWPAGTPSSSDADTGQSFSNLECLSLSGNQLSKWTSIDALGRLPKLCAVNIEGNPIGGGSLGPRQIRQLLIARVGSLAVLNNSQVRRKERLDAEKMYIKIVLLEAGKSWEKMETDEKKVALATHPRIEELIGIHGLPASFRTGAGEATEASALGSVTVTLRSIAVASAATQPKQQRLPTTMTVATLKMLCARLFKIPQKQVELVYQDSDNLSIPQPLDDEACSIAYYGVFDGGTIVAHNTEDNKKKK